jgi:ABC-2 type transport system ATP-binding protein
MTAIEVRKLHKRYFATKRAPGFWGSIKGVFLPERTAIDAVKEVSFSIGQGEMVGFLGPNGAGKTTTLKMLSGILHPTSGDAEVLGFVPFQRKAGMLRQVALVMGNKNQLWWDLPAIDSFHVLKELYEVPDGEFKRRCGELVELLDLGDKVNTQVRKLSLGERMKCELVAAFLHAPKVIFLDEPTIGLDVVSQKRIREFLKYVRRRDNCTVMLTSHYMQDVEELCERVIIIDHGSMVFDGTLNQLEMRYAGARRLRLQFAEPVLSDAFTKYGRVLANEEASVVLEVAMGDVASVASSILTDYQVNDIAIEDVDVEEIIRDMFEQPVQRDGSGGAMADDLMRSDP